MNNTRVKMNKLVYLDPFVLARYLYTAIGMIP